MAVSEKEKHRVEHHEQIEKKRGGGGGHARGETDEKRTGGFRGVADLFQQLLLAGHIFSQCRKSLYQPLVHVEGAGGAQVLSQPRNSSVTHRQCLLQDDAQKCADGAKSQNEQHQQGKRCAQ